MGQRMRQAWFSQGSPIGEQTWQRETGEPGAALSLDPCTSPPSCLLPCVMYMPTPFLPRPHHGNLVFL